jgi:hypothetical protein
MAKFKVRPHRERIAFEIGRDLRQEIARWAVSERRTVSNLVRDLLTDAVNEQMPERMAARGTARVSKPMKQLSA